MRNCRTSFIVVLQGHSYFIAGRPKAALLFWFFMVVLLFICLWSASIVATCIAAHQFPSVMLYNKKKVQMDVYWFWMDCSCFVV